MLLSLSFPKLRLIWSSSPYATAEIFRDLKTGYAEPDPTHAALVGLDDYARAEKGGDLSGNGGRIWVEEMIRSLPGMTISNANMMLRGSGKRVKKVNSLGELCRLSEREMRELLGHDSGKKLYRFVNQVIDQEEGKQ